MLDIDVLKYYSQAARLIESMSLQYWHPLLYVPADFR